MNIYIIGGELVNPGDLSWDCFSKYGNVVNLDYIEKKDLAEKIKDADVLIGAPDDHFGEEDMKYAKNLKYIGLLSTGYNNIDLEYCKKRGIVVSNNPNYGAQMVSQYAISLLMELCCHISKMNEMVHQRKWKDRAQYVLKYPEIELCDKTMGIIGFGNIGRKTGRMAQALGMKVLYNDVREVVEENNENCRFASLDEIFSLSDVIVLHCPLLPETEHIINENTISKMKDGVLLINNARGPLVDEKALAVALKSGKIGGAGLDVTNVEPIEDDNPLLECENCIITPHFSWLAKETRIRIINNCYVSLEAFLRGEPINRLV